MGAVDDLLGNEPVAAEATDDGLRRELRIAVEAARLGVWRADLKTMTVATSQFGGPLTSLPAASLPKNIEEFTALIHPEDREAVNLALTRAVAEGIPYSVDFRIVPPDGSPRWVHARGEVLRNEAGEPSALVGIDMDITDRKRAEDERLKLETRMLHAQRLESLGVLAGGIAHDFNNLLVGILGNADLALMEMQRGAPGRERIKDIRTAGLRASELTGQMLAYSGKGKFVVEPLDPNSVITEMSQLLRVATSKRCSLRYDLAEDLPQIEADVAQIRQVVMNLITNASEAIGDRSGIISVRTGIVDADSDYVDRLGAESLTPGRYVFLEVSDDGCGMDEATRKRIFEPFFTTKFTGRGLGLAGVLGIVKGHRGAMLVYSEPNKGSTFKVLLPAASGDAAPGVERTQNEDEAPWKGTGKVLVVDDDPTAREVIAAVLTHAGFSVIAAEDGLAGVEAFKQLASEFVLVLLDMTMPRLSGEGTFRKLRSIRADVPVILMSGYNEMDVTNRFVGTGLAGFLQKPFRVAELLELVRSSAVNQQLPQR